MLTRRPNLRLVRGLAGSALVLNVLLVVSGGAVRLTDSGLGCPTWPRCSAGSLTVTPALGIHGGIEFGNRLLGVALEIAGIGLLAAVCVARPRMPRAWRWLAAVQALVVPVQAVVGGVLVLTELNPYVRALHFLVSFPITLSAAALLRRTLDGLAARGPLVRVEMRWLTSALLLVTSAVVVVGALVTGTGPHAGDPRASARIPLDPQAVIQVHTDLVWILVGLAAATAVTARIIPTPAPVRRSISCLIALIAVQAVLGYVQYFTGVPSVLVALHMLDAALLFTTAAWIHLSTTGCDRQSEPPTSRSRPWPALALDPAERRPPVAMLPRGDERPGPPRSRIWPASRAG